MKEKVWLLSLMLLMLAVALTGCGGTGDEAPGDDEVTGDGIRVGIVTTSGVDDGSFGEDCYNGAVAFIEDHPDSTLNDVRETDLDKVIQAVSDVIADYDVLILPGFQFANIGQIAPNNPDKNIILVDTAPTNEEGEEVELDNVYSMVFAEQESGFFAGVAAALETKTGKVAPVNGIAYPSNVNYQFGFMSGVNYANKNLGTDAEIIEIASYAGTDVTGTDVGGNYIGAFADEPTGKVLGDALLNEGADILFVAAGASGNGVFTAVKEASDAYVIGCDVDQYDDGVVGDRNIVLTSALKVMNINVTRQLEAIYDGTFQGKNDLLTAASDSTDIVTEPGRHQMSDETVEILDEVYPLVKDGTIVPASNFNGHSPSDFPGL